MKRLFFPALFCAVFCGLVLASNSFSGPFAARREARRAARQSASSGCSGSSSAAAACSGSSAGMTYTYVLPAAPPPPAAIAPTPPPKPASNPNIVSTPKSSCGPDCQCLLVKKSLDPCETCNVRQCTPAGCTDRKCELGQCLIAGPVAQQEAVKPNRPNDGTLVIYGGRMWRWNTAGDEWKLVDVETTQAVATQQVGYSQPVYLSTGSCAGGSCR